MDKISIYTLLGEIEKTRQHPSLHIAQKSDYNCYMMTNRDYEKDQKDKIFFIGYSQDVRLEGLQFVAVCCVENGKFEKLDIEIQRTALPLLKLYTANRDGKNIIVCI